MAENILTDKELDEIASTATEVAYINGGVSVYEIKDKVEVDENAELISEVVETMPSAEGVDIYTAEDYNPDEAAKTAAVASAKESFDLTDDDTYKVLTVIENMNRPSYNVYSNLPDQLKKVIDTIMHENKIPLNERNKVARMVMQEFISDSDVDKAFVDLQKALDEALEMPSIMDMYTEHTKKVMEVNIPEMVEKIKDEYPDKAEQLLKVKDAFTRSYNFSTVKEMYETNGRLRKTIRRHDKELKRAMDEFNFHNERSNFKMNDVRELPEVLNFIFLDEPLAIVSSDMEGHENFENALAAHPNHAHYFRIIDLEITETDISKLCVALCKSCANLDPTDVIDASYMYYMMKNIIVLRHTQEAKTDFAVELINNICDLIVFIRNKEAEFNEFNLDQSKRTKKSGSEKHRKD